MSVKQVFKMPKPVKISGRTSSITNSFVNRIIPVIEPSEEEIREALEILDMDEEKICCAYCGDTYTEWDHLRPLVINKTATGYVSEIHNLVPACGKCNQSKGNQNWRDWMYSNATLSPTSRKIPDIEKRCDCLSKYENWGTPLKVDIELLIGKYKWQQHWSNCDKIISLMKESQILSDEIKKTIQDALYSDNKEIAECFYCNQVNDTATPISVQTDRIAENPIDESISQNQIDKKAVGKIVQSEFITLLKSDKISDNIIEYLEKAEYSKQMFDINYPILLRINTIAESKKGVDYTGVNRYYAKPIQIRGRLYLVTSQWYDRNKDKLLQWMRSYY